MRHLPRPQPLLRTLLTIAIALAGGTTAAAPAGATGGGVTAFHVPWDPASQAGLAAHLGHIDVFAPQWIAVTTADGTLATPPDLKALATLKGAKGTIVLPVITNAHDGVWDGAAAEGVMARPEVRAKVIARLVALAKARGWGGYVFDFEALPPTGVAAYPGFVAQARKALTRAGKTTWVTAFLSADPAVLKPLADASDRLVLMAYDECWSTSTPGPVAGEDWLEAVLPVKLAALDPGKALLAVGAYGYDWPVGKPATVIGVPAAKALAAAHGVAITHDPASANATFKYQDTAGVRHTVWMTDAFTWSYERAAARAAGLRGVAVWRLGLEDPAIWTTPPAGAPYGTGNPPAKLPRCFLLGSPWATGVAP